MVRRPLLWILLAALLGPARTVGLYVTAGSLALEPDAAEYLYSARQLLRGSGFIGTDGRPLTIVPPGFPAAVAAADAVVPGGVMAAAVVVNALALFALAVAVGLVTRRSAPRWWVSPLVVALFSLSPVIQGTAGWAMSEPLALALCAWAFLGAIRDDPAPPWMVALAGLAAGASVLVRTSSAFFVIGLAAALWAHRRILHGVLVGALGALPSAGWAVWNQFASGNAAGVRGAPVTSPLEDVRQSVSTVAQWLSPHSGRPWSAIGAVATVTLVVVVVRSRPFSTGSRSAVILLAIVTAGMIGTTFRVAVDRLDNRLMAPVFLAAALVVATTVGRWGTSRLDRVLAAVVAAGAASGAVQGLMIRHVVRTDPINAVSCDLPAADVTMSNDSSRLAYHCDRPIQDSPRVHLYASTQTTDELGRLATQQKTACVQVVWLGDEAPSFYNFYDTPHDLESIGFGRVPIPGGTLLRSAGCP